MPLHRQPEYGCAFRKGEFHLELAVEMVGITKRFPKVLANDAIDFSVAKGEIHALVGENGAGKSTLMNLLYGLYSPTNGSIRIGGEEVHLGSALDAIRHGVGMVHQHFMLIERLTVTDNIVLGVEPRKGISYDREAAVERVKQVCETYGLYVDAEKRVADCSLGMQQRVEIVKALYRGAEIIILDEPTAVLTPQEIRELGLVLHQLKESGKTIIIITHKLDEVMDFSDRVTVLRKGKKIGTVVTGETSPEEITQMMVGRHVELGGHKLPLALEETVLQVKDLSLQRGKRRILRDISFSIKAGEILGVAGIDGSGQTELGEIIAGVCSPTGGEILYRGADITGLGARGRKQEKIGYIPQDRNRHGLVGSFTIQENLALGFVREAPFSRGLVLDSKALRKNALEKINAFDIRTPSERAAANTLSGGNQQKVIVAIKVVRSCSYP